MEKKMLTLSVGTPLLAVVSWKETRQLPAWAFAGDFWQVSQTPGEVTLVCEEEQVPEGVSCQRGWIGLRVELSTELSVAGILSSALAPIAEAGVGIFAFSTFERDYVLVQESVLETALQALETAGHKILR